MPTFLFNIICLCTNLSILNILCYGMMMMICVCVYCLVIFSVKLPEQGKVKLGWWRPNVLLCSLLFSIDLLWPIACDNAQGVWMQFVSLTLLSFEVKKLIFCYSLLLWLPWVWLYLSDVSYLSNFFANTTSNAALPQGKKGTFKNVGNFCM